MDAEKQEKRRDEKESERQNKLCVIRLFDSDVSLISELQTHTHTQTFSLMSDISHVTVCAS